MPPTQRTFVKHFSFSRLDVTPIICESFPEGPHYEL